MTAIYTEWHSERDTAEGGRSYEAMITERDPALGFLDVGAAASVVIDLQRWRHRSRGDMLRPRVRFSLSATSGDSVDVRVELIEY